MTTHLPGWSKMNFQKKSKPTASVAGRPSPKTLRKNKSTRSTKSEAQVPPEDTENNNSQESLEQDFKEKIDLESKFVPRRPSVQGFTWQKPMLAGEPQQGSFHKDLWGTKKEATR